jgi:hypothetical protein
MSKKIYFNQINLIIFALILFACGTPGSEISSPVGLDADSIPTEVPAATNTPELSLTPSIPQEELIEIWRPLIGSYFLVDVGCQITGEMLLEFSESDGEALDKLGTSLGIGLFLNAARESVLDWEPQTDMQKYKDNSINYLESIQETIGDWLNDELTDEHTIQEINGICQTIDTELEDLGNIASEVGLTRESIEAIGQQIDDPFTEFQQGIDIEEGEE